MLALRSDRRSLVVGKGVIRSMFAVFALSLLLSVAIDVEVRTVDGSSAAGTMAALDAEQVQLVHADASKSSLPMESVLSISRMPEAAAPKFVVDAMQVTLVCDSKLTARALDQQTGLSIFRRHWATACSSIWAYCEASASILLPLWISSGMIFWDLSWLATSL